MKAYSVVKRFLKAKSPEKLELEMVKNNVLHGTSFDYDIMQSNSGVWFAWFYIDINLSNKLERIKGPKK